MDQREIMQTLQAALAHHQAGRGDEAARMYRDVLSVSADNADALHLLGVLEAQRGKPQEGLALDKLLLPITRRLCDAHIYRE